MPESSFLYTCIAETADGLRDGLSHFSAASRVAVVYALTPTNPLFVYDPQNLLHGHEPMFRKLYIDDDTWRRSGGDLEKSRFSHMRAEKNLELAGLISFGGRSGPVFYQMWFTEHHPDMCAIGPTECWLEHAAWRLTHDVANGKELYTGISGSFLREYATHAVRDYLIDQMNIQLGWDTQLRIYPILDTILGISRTREEGAWPRGELLFTEWQSLSQITFITRFPQNERPLLENFKHIRKLLQTVEFSERKLISDGKSLVGISDARRPAFCLIADFRGRHGFLKINDHAVCSFADGQFKSTTHMAKLVQIEELLLEADLDGSAGSRLFKIVAALVHTAETEKYGCTIIIDLNHRPLALSGQKLEAPLDLQEPEHLELAKSMAKVDGALHVGADLRLHGFACLLDGRAIPGEDRARGARYNSALRFTAEQRNIVVVVVSADRPVSIITEGVELNAQCQWGPSSTSTARPLRLEDWLAKNGS